MNHLNTLEYLALSAYERTQSMVTLTFDMMLDASVKAHRVSLSSTEALMFDMFVEAYLPDIRQRYRFQFASQHDNFSAMVDQAGWQTALSFRAEQVKADIADFVSSQKALLR